MNVHSHLLRFTTLVALAAGVFTHVFAGEISGQEKALAIEAARADLYAQLIRQVKGIQVSENTIVANMVTEAAEKSASTEGYIRGVKLGDPQFVGDVCFIDGELTLRQVVENLNSIVRVEAGQKTAYERVEQLNQTRVIRARGAGTTRAKTEIVGDVPLAEDGLGDTIARLSGSGQHKLGAVEAARIDALAQLARQIKGVRVSDDSSVFNMASAGRLTDTESQALVRGAIVLRYSAVDSELVACTMQITLRQLVENIESTYAKKTVAGITVSERLSERIEQFNPNLARITATGYGALRTKQSATTEVIGSVQ